VGPKDFECRLVDVGRCFPGVLIGSRALRWRVPRMVLGAAMCSDAVLGF
jgi:hypothetical protein